MKESRTAWKLHIEATNEQFAAGELHLGPWTSYSMMHDPKHTAFVLSRYKFCSKLLAGKSRVLEVGCGDGFGAPIIAAEVGELHCVDWEPRNIEGNRRRLPFLSNTTFEVLDVSTQPPPGRYDGMYNIDVLEHVEPEFEIRFMDNITAALEPEGILIVGTPNESSARYATHRSDHQHINLKSAASLKELMLRYFHNCFVFSMNDEVVHTGYYPMAHYLFAVGVGKRDRTA